MDFSVIMQYISYLLVAIGVMAFVVSTVTQVVKSWPGLDKLPTSVVVIVLSLVLCPVTFVALMAWMDREITWYMVFACMIGAFIVALVAMDGWERLKEIWDRTGYQKRPMASLKKVIRYLPAGGVKPDVYCDVATIAPPPRDGYPWGRSFYAESEEHIW